MKKIFSFVLLSIMIFSLSGCENANPQQNNNQSSTTPTPKSTGNPESENDDLNTENTVIPENDVNGTNILVVYFSMPETTDSNNMTRDEDNSVVVIDGEVLGNTQYVAYLIKENTGGDIFRIEPKTPYPTDHSALVDLADKEKSENARPELAANVENIEQYDTIFVGYPNWWADLPMILYSFLESVDLSNKTVIPFNTHGGSGFSQTIKTISDLQPNAKVITDGYTVSRNNVESAENDVIEWLNKLGY